MQRPTNLIQTFRLPDKGSSPGAPPLITTAIKRPVWTRDVLHINQGSAALVSPFFLGNSRGALGEMDWKATHLNQDPLPPPPCVCEERGGQIYPHDSGWLSGLCTYVRSPPHSRLLTRCSVSHPQFSSQKKKKEKKNQWPPPELAPRHDTGGKQRMLPKTASCSALFEVWSDGFLKVSARSAWAGARWSNLWAGNETATGN